MKRWLIAGSLVLVSTTAMAAGDTGPFIAASAGNAKYDLSKGDLDAVVREAYTSNGVSVLNTSSNYDDTGSAWSVFMGYRPLRYASVEGGYVDLGSAQHRSASTVRVRGSSQSIASTIATDLSAKGLFAEVSGIAPLGSRLDVHAHLGTLYSQTKINVRVSLASTNVPQSETRYAANLFAGVGASFRFTRNLAAMADLTYFNAVGSDDNRGDLDITALRIGLQCRF